MDLDNILNDVIKDDNAAAGGEDQEAAPVLDDLPAEQLVRMDLNDEAVRVAIYKRWRADSIDMIDSFIDSPLCRDSKANNGMFACSHDTWEACITDIGIDYFKKYKYIHDRERERTEGGARFNDDLMAIGLEVYEYLCNIYRKAFQPYDACRYLGISKDYMYQLSELHGLYMKKASTASENSLRIGAITGRGNITGNIMMLNHDHGYVRTAEVIHSTSSDRISADRLPDLMQPPPQHVVLTDNIIDAPAIPDDM